MNINEKVKHIYNAIDEKLGIDIKMIDISKISVLADYLIISGANNKSQVQAIVDNITEKLDQENIHVRHIEGYSTANWVLLDYNDVIVHVFNQEDRLFYDLERLWQDGISVEVETLDKE